MFLTLAADALDEDAYHKDGSFFDAGTTCDAMLTCGKVAMFLVTSQRNQQKLFGMFLELFLRCCSCECHSLHNI